MKTLLSILALSVATQTNAQQCNTSTAYAVGLHGGAYTNGENISVQQMTYIRELAAQIGRRLRNGASAVDAVELAVGAMEESGLYNAGRASITNQEGYVENDASIMDGSNLNAGAVGSLIETRSPVHAARLVMDQSRHAMVVGDRGEKYVRELGAEKAPKGWFLKAGSEEDEHGTVGAVALDRCGNLAAATSTGGYDAKVPGRLGDVPVIGAGTYADNDGAAVSATGHGEFFIRHAAAHTTSLLVEGGLSPLDAATTVLEDMVSGRDGLGSMIVLDAEGNFAAPHSTRGVIHAFASDDRQAYSQKTSGAPVGGSAQ
ncbi:isoaspartyl peptidase/L-asparaginase family protein [Parvularcula maris]|uniref:Isoaspartyl peptidase n=1 Tax=Parvularcula maris TaxID=2965077 RepID=A0A9X2RKA7_9PROT|nr:isoaspartyl peptidase/L-asparaginase family protein [Parvularcula maris]MCQ8185583.1 isoaspartyl peptidase/L-asparaginase family protein [Parvularcula maris]